MIKAQILIVEDDDATVGVVREFLQEEGFAVAAAPSLSRARSAVEKAPPDLLIIDRRLPDGDGLDLCKELRRRPERASLPVLFLTSKKTLAQKVSGFEAGGDDYLPKPFEPEELLARVEALLRRAKAGPAPEAVLASGPVRLEVETRQVAVSGRRLALTPKEFDLLKTLLERQGRVLSRSFLLSRVWGYGPDVEVSTRSVDVMVAGLRKKLGAWGERIETSTRLGYRLKPEGEK